VVEDSSSTTAMRAAMHSRSQVPATTTAAPVWTQATAIATRTAPATLADRYVMRASKSLDAVAAICMIAASAALIRYSFHSESPSHEPPALPKEPIAIADAAREGSASAPAVIVEFSDFECPYCRKFATETLPVLRTDLIETGKVLFVFRHFPLDKIHADAVAAAHSAECARRLGRFWQFHDALFALGKLESDDIGKTSAEIGLASPGFAACRDSRDVADLVQKDHDAGVAAGVSATPTFFLGTLDRSGMVVAQERLTGAAPLSGFVTAVSRIRTTR
jgi:protein-disulfide isomerase